MNKYAVIIGVGRTTWDNSNLGADNDARLISNILKRDYGFEMKDITLLTNRTATYSNVKNAVLDIANKANENSTVVFTFAGHGGYGGISLWDGGYTANELANDWSNLKSSKVFIQITSCYAGYFVPPVAGPGRIIRTSSDKTVSVDGQHYTHFGDLFWDNGIRQRKADETPNGNGDGIVSIEEACRYVMMGVTDDQYPGDMIL